MNASDDVMEKFEKLIPKQRELPEFKSFKEGIQSLHRTAVGNPAEGRGERLRIGHNEQFDARIVRIGTMRYAPLFADPWKAGKAECTARMATPICAIPPTEKMRAAKRFHHKTPNLGEAYAHFCGANLQDAHSALADARACSRIYFAMRAPKSDHGADSPLETTHE